MQHHQRVCPATEGRAQAVPDQGADPAAQGQVPQSVPRAVGLLCCSVPGEGPHPHGAGHQGAAQDLAKDVQSERGWFMDPHHF